MHTPETLKPKFLGFSRIAKTESEGDKEGKQERKKEKNRNRMTKGNNVKPASQLPTFRNLALNATL